MVDLLIRISAQLKGFFKSLYNIIDICVVLIYFTSWILDQTYPYYITNVGIRVVRGIKILRIIRIIPAIRSLELVVNALLYTMRTAVLDVIVLALMIIFCLGVLGHFMFGTDPTRTPAYASWSDLGSSFMTIWVYICGDGWLPYQDQLRLSGYTASEPFSILLIYLGNVIISNLFIGVISQNIYEASQTERLAQLAAQKEAKLAKRELFFRKQQRDLMQLLQQKTSKNGGFQDIIRNLAGALRHDEIVRVKTLPMDLLWLETFVVTLHYHENTMFRCQQSHFAIAQSLAEYGFIGVLLMTIMFSTQHKSFSNPTGRIIVAITICNLLDSVLQFIGRFPINSGIRSFGCQAQGFMISQIFMTEWLLGFTITLYILLIIFFNFKVSAIREWESTIISMCIILPLPLSFIILFAKPDGVHPLIGDADFWCWISSDYYAVYQVGLGLLPNIAIIVGETLSFLAIAVTISGNNKEIQEMLSKPYKRYIITRMLAYMIAFWIIWAPTLINRIAQYAVGQPVFTLALINAIFTPAQGLIHFLVFLVTWYAAANYRYLSPLVRYPDSALVSDKENEHPLYQNPYTNYSDIFDNGFDSMTVLNTVMNSLPPLEGLPKRRMSVVVHDTGRRSLDQATERTSLDELDGVSKFRESHRHSVA
ncbi:Cation channel sperm-associated protein 3 [Terramyces sp. JEL0728]|nr:Cation channel sperm-associated protein 3 [Terramyces sp. JEL0728]